MLVCFKKKHAVDKYFNNDNHKNENTKSARLDWSGLLHDARCHSQNVRSQGAVNVKHNWTIYVHATVFSLLNLFFKTLMK